MTTSLSRSLTRQQRPLPRIGTRGLTHWWPLNDAFSPRSQPLVSSIQVTNATISPASGPPVASPNSAASLTASGSLMTLSAAPHVFGGGTAVPFSLSFWANLVSFTTFDASALGRFVSWGTSANSDEITIMCGAAGNGSIEFRTVQNGTSIIQNTTAASLFSLGVWNHFAGTSDGTTLKMYINGVNVALSAGGNSVTTAATWCFGARASATRVINGKMADVRFANGTQWSAAEVAQLYLNAFEPVFQLPVVPFGVVIAAGYTPYNPWPQSAPVLAQ